MRITILDFGWRGRGARTFAKDATHSFRLGREGMGAASVQFDGCGATIKQYYLIIRDSVSRLRASGGVVELQSNALPTRVNCSELSGAVWLGESAIGVLGVSIGLLGYMGGQSGHDLFTLQNFDLTAAIPFDPVIAAFDCFAIDNDLVSQRKFPSIIFCSDCSRRKQKRATQKQC
jgi:hypothetical protein